jgi:hypothetical protein
VLQLNNGCTITAARKGTKYDDIEDDDESLNLERLQR